MGGMAGRQPDMLAAAVQLQPQQSRHRKQGKEGSRPGQKPQQRTWEARPKGRAVPGSRGAAARERQNVQHSGPGNSTRCARSS